MKRDWDIVTSYIDKVGTSDKVVSFNKLQDSVRVKNQGNVNLIYTIGTKSGTLIPNASITVSENLSSFTVKASSGSCEFEVRATEAGTETEEIPSVPGDIGVQLNDLTTQLAQSAKQADLTTTNNVLILKADKSYVDSEIAKKASGAPKGVYATLSALQTALPTGSPDNQLVTADGKWYYWSGSAWAAGAVYQSTGIADGSVKPESVVPNTFERVKKSGNMFKGAFNPKTVADVIKKGANGGDGVSEILLADAAFGKYGATTKLKIVRSNATTSLEFAFMSNGNSLIPIADYGILSGDTVSFGGILKSSDALSMFMLYQYDINKAYIGGSGVFTTTTGVANTVKLIKNTAVINANTKYISLVPFSNTAIATTVEMEIIHWYVVKGISEDVIYTNEFEVNYLTKKEYEELNPTQINDSINTIIADNVLKPSENLYNKDGELLDGYIFTGGAVFGSGTYKHQNIAVVEGQTYNIEASINLSFLDANKQFVSTLAAGAYTNGVFTVPTGTGVKYVALTIPNGSISTQYLVKGSIKPSSTPMYGRKMQDYTLLSTQQTNQVNTLLSNNPVVKPFVNKKYLILGDSITAIGIDPRGWLKYFNEIIVPNSFTNVAVSGATWCDKVGTVYDGNPVINGADNNVNNVIGNQVKKIQNNAYPAPDVIIIAAGTNDTDVTVTDADIELQFFSGGANVPIGNVDRKTWAGAVRYTVETLRTTYPNAQIFLTTPVQRANTTINNYDVIRRKNEIIKKMGLRMSVPVIDTEESGIYGQNAVDAVATLDHNDGLHLSAIGAEKMGKYTARKIINWFCF
jgi:lysophospholipase L1-like esterase